MATKEITQTKFLSEIGGVNSNSFQRFMKLKGPYTGSDNGTYAGSLQFFHKREKASKIAKTNMSSDDKKRKREETSSKKNSLNVLLAKIEGIALPPVSCPQEVLGYQTLTYGDFPVLDSCDDVRKKSLEFMAKNNVTTNAFIKVINVNSKSWKSFMELKGGDQISMQPGAGNGSYPAAYSFLEKIRIAHNEPKSKKRIEFENAHPNGYGLKHDKMIRWVAN